MASVGIIVNPWAGKDVRRLYAPVGHTSDAAKIGIVRQVAIGALEAGASRVVAVHDVARLAERALAGLDAAVLLDGASTGSALDSRDAARQLAAAGCRPLVVLGGDGTCRDVAKGAPAAAMIPISTGTNNVFPVFVDGLSAGIAAGLVARDAIGLDAVGRPAKVLHIDIHLPDGTFERDIALVDVALIDAARTGARAVVRAEAIRTVVAAIAAPASTGLSSIAGRLQPIARHHPGAVVVQLGHGRAVRAPIVPGAFADLLVARVDELADGESIELTGPGVLAYDGERERVLPPGAIATVTVRGDGPVVIDVERALHCAARRGLFDTDTRRPVPAGEDS